MIAAAPGNGYMLWSGSSAAAPLVTGVAALLKQKYPQESAAQLAQRLIASADDEGATGRDPLYGYGVFNPQDAMALPSPTVTANPLGSMSEWIAVHRKHQVSAPSPSDAGHCGCALGVGHDYYRRCGASSASDARAGRRRGPSGGDRGARAGASRGGARAASASSASPARRFVVVAVGGPAGLHFLRGGGAANAGPLYFLP